MSALPKTAVLWMTQGAGKSTHGQSVADLLGCTHVVDDWLPSQPITTGALHLTSGLELDAGTDKPTHRNVKGWEEKLRWAIEDLADPTVPASTKQACLQRLVPYLKELAPLAWAELQRQKSESSSRKEAP